MNNISDSSRRTASRQVRFAGLLFVGLALLAIGFAGAAPRKPPASTADAMSVRIEAPHFLLHIQWKD